MDTTNKASTSSYQLVKTKFEPSLQQQKLTMDAFSYYSNKFNRMKALLLKEDDVEVIHNGSSITTQEEPAAKRQKCIKSHPIQDGGVRQTRISFEIHPSLILYDDLIHESGQMESGNISDDEEESGSGKKK